MANKRTMELTFRGKHSFDNCNTKGEFMERCDELKDWFDTIPEEAVIENTEDDYISFYVDAKDKDDVKYYKRKGFN